MSRMSLLTSTLAMRNTLRRSGKSKSSSNSGNSLSKSFVSSSVLYDTALSEKAKSPNTPLEELEKIKTLGLNDKKYFLRYLVENPSVPGEWFEEMLEAYPRIAYYVAVSDRCPLDLLIKLSEKPYDSIDRSKAISNPKFPIDKAIEKCKEDSFFVRSALREISKRNNLTLDDIKKILEFKDEQCDYAIIMNPITPIEILKDFINGKFIKDRQFGSYAKNALIRRAGDLKTNPNELREISKIKDVNLKILVANNPSCPPDVFKMLMNAPLSLFFNKEARKKKRTLVELNRKPVNKEELNKNAINKIKPIKKEEPVEIINNDINEEIYTEKEENTLRR